MILFDRTNQNTKGSKLASPGAYHNKLMATMSYIKASTIMKQRYNITFFINP